jgi:hypothetical protein
MQPATPGTQSGRRYATIVVAESRPRGPVRALLGENSLRMRGRHVARALLHARNVPPPKRKSPRNVAAARRSESGATNAAASTTSGPSPSVPKRHLTVALYPLVPHPEEMFADAKTAFESAHPGVSVERVDLGHYYDPSATDSIVPARPRRRVLSLARRCEQLVAS